MRAARTHGRITAPQLGLVVNTDDPYSVAVAAQYVQARKLQPHQVLRLKLPVKSQLSKEEFQSLAEAVQAHFGPSIQALALAWKKPYAVECNSITAALTLGFDGALCSQTCGRSRESAYFNASTSRPYTDLRLRPSMLLAAPNVESATALILRGVAADGTLAWRGRPPVQARYLVTSDSARSVRAGLFPPSGLVKSVGVQVQVQQADAIAHVERLLLYQTGLQRVPQLDTLRWVPGALADHLTSFGGRLDHDNGQMNVLAWIGSGATASYGTVSEPCAHPQKFPHPQLLLLHYAQGSSAIEAYWKSVAWPQQGLFVGEPLAAPFAPSAAATDAGASRPDARHLPVPPQQGAPQTPDAASSPERTAPSKVAG